MTNDGSISLCAKTGCGFLCCKFDQGNHIALFPGELEEARGSSVSLKHLEIVGEDGDGGHLAICRASDPSRCDGGYKPLDCRSYPYFPLVDNKREFDLYRGKKCPLLDGEITKHRDAARKMWEDECRKNFGVLEWLQKLRVKGYTPVVTGDHHTNTSAFTPVIHTNKDLVAISGIDGAGKSTICRKLGLTHDNIRVISKIDRRNIQNIQNIDPERAAVSTNLLDGSYANAVRFAHAFDFLAFYQSQYSPLRSQSGIIVSDRWATCSIAYADTFTDQGQTIEHLLSGVERPGVTIFLDVQPEEAFRRIKMRGTPNADETLEMLIEYRNAYLRYFESREINHVTIDAENFDVVFDQVEDIVKRRIRGLT